VTQIGHYYGVPSQVAQSRVLNARAHSPNSEHDRLAALRLLMPCNYPVSSLLGCLMAVHMSVPDLTPVKKYLASATFHQKYHIFPATFGLPSC